MPSLSSDKHGDAPEWEADFDAEASELPPATAWATSFPQVREWQVFTMLLGGGVILYLIKGSGSLINYGLGIPTTYLGLTLVVWLVARRRQTPYRRYALAVVAASILITFTTELSRAGTARQLSESDRARLTSIVNDVRDGIQAPDTATRDKFWDILEASNLTDASEIEALTASLRGGAEHRLLGYQDLKTSVQQGRFVASPERLAKQRELGMTPEQTQDWDDFIRTAVVDGTVIISGTPYEARDEVIEALIADAQARLWRVQELLRKP